ncbi:HTH_Tnp_Tc3_2 domain-containing protein [Trichonephila clavipes]|nr:HTH_Tnp_Tc3_2 domain-containing protein [Trichonephila clavipes]
MTGLLNKALFLFIRGQETEIDKKESKREREKERRGEREREKRRKKQKLVVGIDSMGKLPDLDAFDREQIAGARRMGHPISEIVRQIGFSRSTLSILYQEYMDGGQNNSDRANCKGQLALTVRAERRLRHIVRSQRSQTLAQITTEFVRHWDASRAWAREHRDWSVDDWKRVAWSDESLFRKLNADGRQAHEVMDHACHVGKVQGHGGSIIV